jgi:hypothetical protein
LTLGASIGQCNIVGSSLTNVTLLASQKITPHQAYENLKDNIALSNSMTSAGGGVGNMGRTPKAGVEKVESVKIDLVHIESRHAFGTATKASKFSQGADIEKLIQSSINKKPIRSLSSQGNILKEYDMGKVIGNVNSKPTTKLRVIYSQSGEILSSYPIP